MIDELVKVADATDKAGIILENWHPKLKVLPKVYKKSPCIRIWLTTDGHIKDLEPLSRELAAELRKYEPDNGKSLPGFNVRPLFRLCRADEEVTGRKLEKRLIASLTNPDFDWNPLTQQQDDFWEKTRAGLKRCFGAVCEQLETLCKERLENGETLSKWLSAVKQIDIEQFQKEYQIALLLKIQAGELPLSLMCYFVTEAKMQKEDADARAQVPKYSVFLDIVNYTDYPVAHPRTIKRLNSLLMDNRTNKNETASTKRDAYGKDALHTKDKFPGVTLPLLGGVILRSQAKIVRAQWRYHTCESNTFPVGATTRKRAKAALEWIAAPERDGETHGIAGDSELLFAYPHTLPKDKLPLVKMFGAQPDENLQQYKFERLAQSIISCLKGSAEVSKDADLEIFSLRKMDKARTKVVYYRNTTVASLEAASNKWHDGCQNIPHLTIMDWSEQKDEQTGKSYPVPVVFSTTFPIKLHRFLNTIWNLDGEQAGKAKTFSPADGLKLMLEDHCTPMAAFMMERYMQHAQGYFVTLCRSLGRDSIAKLPDKLYTPGILGLLLSKQGKRKDKYMKESAFLLGRCLRVTDEIHRLYCEIVRKNDLPPELCGSSLLISMMESPTTTLSQLAQRSAPYLKWAKGGSNKEEKGGLVWYWLKQWELIADSLHALEWPKHLSPEERAQLFLGFLSSFPKTEKSENHETTAKTIAQGEENE